MTSSTSQPRSHWQIGVDVGGTFTDLVLADADARRWVAKVPSVPSDPSQGVLAALDRLAADLGWSVEQVLEGCRVFVHGSTVATNTMLENSGARVGLVTTTGFRDGLEIRRGLREDQWRHRDPYAPVLVPRYLRHGIGGRIDADGSELEPVDLDDLAPAVEAFEAEGVEAVAVALFNSFANGDHEAATTAELVDAGFDWVCGSADISPLMGEYERTSTAVVNASLLPKVATYLGRLQQALADRGLRPKVLMVQSNGGAASVDAVGPRPVNLLLSGPAAAVGALQYYAGGIGDTSDGALLSMEIGGTSCDVLLMADGRVDTTDSLSIAGYHVSTPSIDIHTIGAGGGTIAGVDSAGLLFVGPEGAGADPGPACYGRGGTEPTVTDAHLVLGRLSDGGAATDRPSEGPEDRSATMLSLDLEAARTAIETRVAEPLGLSVEEAAAAIITLVEQNLLGAVEYLTIERGHAPEQFTLVAGGGAGPMHGEGVARGLGCRRVYLPRAAGALCAVGMLGTDVRRDFVRFLSGSIDQVQPETVAKVMAELDADAIEALAEEGFEADQVELRHELDLHHPGQMWSIRVELTGAGFDPVALRERFESEYDRLYGHSQVDGTIMIGTARVVAVAALAGLEAPAPAPGSVEAPTPIERRPVWHADAGWVDTDVYRGDQVGAGVELAGPLIIGEATTTVVVGPGSTVVAGVDGYLVTPGVSQRRAVTTEVLSLALVQNRLDQITRHMGWVMTRTARSTIFSQSHDFSCFITDAEGTLVANADGIPIHTGGGGFAVRAVLAAWGEGGLHSDGVDLGGINPGDVFLLSDPYEAGGNHLPDWVIARPIFAPSPDGESLVGFCCNRAHQSDIGGGLAGTYNPEATEIWQEGIRLPVLKLYEQGRVRTDLWQLLLINCRTPELLDGDLLAMVGSTRIGAERVLSLVADYGLDQYRSLVGGILDHGEARMREAIGTVPDGVYQGADLSDNDCFGPLETWIRATVTVDGDAMTVDFTGSDPQMQGFKNSSLANTYSAVYLAVSSFFDPAIPRNEGTYRPLRIIAPEGTIVNARPPAPMTMNTVFVAHEIVHAVWKALAEAVPERALAGWSKTMHGHVAGRLADEVTGEDSTFVMYHWHAMGTPGATAERDGFNQMGHLISLGGLDIPNLEFHEQHFPVRYRRWEFRTDAAGPGRNRGGSGVVYDADVLSGAIWSFRAEGLDASTGYGVLGGGDGAPGREWIRPVDADVDGDEFVPPKYGVRRLAGPGRMVAHTPGGGGWGDPFERPVELVARDVKDGIVSVEAARRVYGVVVDDGGLVDHDATITLRSR